MAERGFLGGIFENDEILWFIILFLLLFWCNRFWGVGGVNTGC